MNITFLVGNGFDLAAGLKTSYKDFCEEYCKDLDSLSDETDDNILAFKNFIRSDETQLWKDFEIAFAKYSNHYKLSTSSLYVECYQDLHSNLASYIKKEENRYDQSLITEDAVTSFCDGILNFYSETDPKEKNSFEKIAMEEKGNSSLVRFISFNYTNILDLYVKSSTSTHKTLSEWTNKGIRRSFKLDSNVLHVHGMTDHYPIFGVTGEQYVDNAELLNDPRVRRSLLKNECVDSLQELWYDQACEYIDKSRVICIFGMSLGESDSYWWKKVISWLTHNRTCHLIVFWHSNNVQDHISPITKLDEIDKVKNMLLGFSNITSEKRESVLERIHVVINAEKMLSCY